jgi:cation:H+ antiporter
MKEILIALLLLVAGFVLLIKGADFFVDGSSSVAKRLRVPSMIIGLTSSHGNKSARVCRKCYSIT